MAGPIPGDALYGLSRTDLLESVVQLAHQMAWQSRGGRIPGHDHQEAVQDAMLAACIAVDSDKYNPAKASYSNYLANVMRYGIMEGLRDRDVVVRRYRWDQDDPRLTPPASLDLQVQGKPTYAELLADDRDDFETIDDAAELTNFKDVIHQYLQGLPPKYQYVIERYYLKDRTMLQIGAELGVTESRISQIHKRALEILHDDIELLWMC